MQATVSTHNRKKRTRRIVLVIILLILAGCVIFGAIRFSQVRARLAEYRAQTGDTVVAFVGDLAATATAIGQIEPSQSARLSSATPGLVEAVFVRAGDLVEEGELLVQFNTDDLVFAVERAEQNLALQEANLAALLADPQPEEITAAQAAVHSARVRLEKLMAGPDQQEIVESEANVRAQQANVASASTSFNSAVGSIKASAIAAAEVELINAQIAYDSAKRANDDAANSATHESLVEAEEDLAIAQAALDELRAGPNQGTVNSAAASLSAAEANLDQAEANHQKLLSDPTPSQIAAAESTLAQAESNLTNLTTGASTEAKTIAEAGVEQARLALADAERSLADAAVRAPFDGVITAVYVAEGEMAAGSVVELVSGDLKVVLSVDEIDIGSLSIGQRANVTLETWPDTEIAAEISSIAPAATSNNGIVTYDVQLNLERAELPILIGMTANAQLIIASHENVLLVPNAAITADRQANTYTVNIVTGEINGLPTTEEVEVTIGLRDGAFTQIISGLSEGDELIVGELTAPTIGFGQGRGPFANGGQ